MLHLFMIDYQGTLIFLTATNLTEPLHINAAPPPPQKKRFCKPLRNFSEMNKKLVYIQILSDDLSGKI